MFKAFRLFVLAGLLSSGAAACADNAEDHAAEAADEAREGDTEDAREEAAEAREDLRQGDTTELRN